MSTSTLHPVRRGTSKIFIYTALLLFVAFLYFIVTNFAGYAWTICFAGALACVIISNVISHPTVHAHGVDGPQQDHNLLGDTTVKDAADRSARR